MKNKRFKIATDLLSMLLTLIAIITGFILHNEVWHLHIFDDYASWGIHEGVGIALLALVTFHCVEHSFWFKNYSKLKINRKRVTTIFLIIAIIVAVTGITLMSGSHSEIVSHIHYAGGILFTIIAVGHVAKRWKLLKSLF